MNHHRATRGALLFAASCAAGCCTTTAGVDIHPTAGVESSLADPVCAAACLSGLSVIADREGRTDDAVRLARRARDQFGRYGDTRGVALADLLLVRAAATTDEDIAAETMHPGSRAALLLSCAPEATNCAGATRTLAVTIDASSHVASPAAITDSRF